MSVAYMRPVLDKLQTTVGINYAPQGYKYRTLKLLMGLYIESIL